jgi:hypothetical protein
LVSIQLLSELISDSHQKKPTLGTVDSDLPDELIEALLEKSLPCVADTDISCFALIKSLVQQLFEQDYINFSGRRR